MPKLDTTQQQQQLVFKQWNEKQYQSLYLNLEDRQAFTRLLYDRIEATNILLNHSVKCFQKYDNGIHIEFNGSHPSVITKKLVIAGGRFSPLDFHFSNKTFQRYEFGARIVAPANVMAALKPSKQTDPKFVYRVGGAYEVRTFCWCENGETTITDSGKVKTYSGRSDVEPTQESNFGLNFRITDVRLAKSLGPQDIVEPFELKPGQVTGENVLKAFGNKTGTLFWEAYEKLLELMPGLKGTATLRGPTIEGVGYYPSLDENTLALKDNQDIYVVGDATGLFRGIVACLLSGYHVANLINTS